MVPKNKTSVNGGQQQTTPGLEIFLIDFFETVITGHTSSNNDYLVKKQKPKRNRKKLVV